MDFFNKLTKKATETYKTAAEKTGKIATETKLKLKINENKSKINDIYTEIGKTVYQKYVLGKETDIKGDLQKELDRLDELSNQIKEYEEEILKLSDMKQCINCKNKIDKDAKFCPSCGAEQPAEVEVIDNSMAENIQENEEKTQETVQHIKEVISDNNENTEIEDEQIVAEVVFENEENGENNNSEEINTENNDNSNSESTYTENNGDNNPETTNMENI